MPSSLVANSRIRKLRSRDAKLESADANVAWNNLNQNLT